MTLFHFVGGGVSEAMSSGSSRPASTQVVDSSNGSAHPNGLGAGVLYGGGHGSKGWQAGNCWGSFGASGRLRGFRRLLFEELKGF